MLQMSQKTHWSNNLISFNQVKTILINSYLLIGLMIYSEMTVLLNQNKAREEPES